MRDLPQANPHGSFKDNLVPPIILTRGSCGEDHGHRFMRNDYPMLSLAHPAETQIISLGAQETTIEFR